MKPIIINIGINFDIIHWFNRSLHTYYHLDFPSTNIYKHKEKFKIVQNKNMKKDIKLGFSDHLKKERKLDMIVPLILMNIS